MHLAAVCGLPANKAKGFKQNNSSTVDCDNSTDKDEFHQWQAVVSHFDSVI